PLVIAGALTALSGCRFRAPADADPPAALPPEAHAATTPPRQPGPPFRFEEISAAAGIHFQYDRASSDRKYFPEPMGGAVAVIDYDNDGRPDLFFPNGAPLPGYRPRRPLRPALYHNLGNARFEDVTRKAGLGDVQMYGMGCAVGDYDNDGFDDLYVTAVLGPSRLFHNRGDGTFQDVAAQAGVTNPNRFGASAAWVD